MEVKVYNYINLDYLDMMSDGDDDMKKTMLEMLFEELPTEMAKMRELTNACDWNELKSVSHKMKSTLSFVGCDAMTNSNSEIELICKDGGDTSKVESLMTILEDNLPHVMDELKTEHTNM